MAKLPTIKKLLQEDFKDQPWIGRLLSILNQFMESTSAALNKNLTRSDNFNGEIKSVTLQGTLPLKISTSIRPIGVQKIGLRRADGQPLVLSTAVDFTWSSTSEGIQIDSLVGIVPSPVNQFVLVLELIGG